MSLVNFLVSVCVSLLLLGCNNSSNPEMEKEQAMDVVQPIDPDNSTDHIEQNITCSGLAKLDFIEATATAELSGYNASNTIDSEFMASSRWSTLSSEQSLVLSLESVSLLKGISLTWLNLDGRTYSYDVEISQDKETWIPLITAGLSDSSSTRSQFTEISEHSARYVKVISRGNNINSATHLVEVEAFGCVKNVNSSIELNDWYLSIPVDESTNTKAKSIYESTLVNNYFNAEFFFLNLDGGLVFRAPIEGAKTSSNTKYTRTELREMLRRGNTNLSTQGVNKNNWVFSSAPMADQESAGGVDGELVAELAVNHVTTTGEKSQVGRVIIGQIHANDDEPIRVYYRKLPQNSKGSIYLAHEIEGGDDIYVELIGTRSQSAENPSNGIKLNERFGYKISVTGNSLTLTVIRQGQTDIVKTVDMADSGYDLGGQYMYFKAGVYNQNNSGDIKDYVQATFYRIENSHIGYRVE